VSQSASGSPTTTSDQTRARLCSLSTLLRGTLQNSTGYGLPKLGRAANANRQDQYTLQGARKATDLSHHSDFQLDALDPDPGFLELL
jgi:hypothetical protein